MPTNLELKARIGSIAAAAETALALPATSEGELLQTDTYYTVPSGRLKLRQFGGRADEAELIFYNRAEEGEERLSHFLIYPAQAPEELDRLLTQAFGRLAQVRKRRLLFLFEGARIHLDEVEGLGSFIEFEVPVKGLEADAARTLSFLRKAFSIGEGDCFRHSYLDLTLQSARGAGYAPPGG